MKTNPILIFTLSTLLIVLGTTISDSHQIESNTSQTKTGNMKGNQSLESKIDTLKHSMLDYMNATHPSYTEKDVNECADMLNTYLIEMAKTHSKEEGMQVVKATILKLNNLNARCNSELIETDERESIAEIIIIAGNRKGYNAPNEDITEAWREW
jgi:hypothetical protein